MQKALRVGILAYVGVTLTSLLLSRLGVLDSVPQGFAPLVFAVLGPSSRLLWGAVSAPLFVAATMLWLVAVTAAALVYAQWTARSVATAGCVFCAALWLAPGWWAWIVEF